MLRLVLKVSNSTMTGPLINGTHSGGTVVVISPVSSTESIQRFRGVFEGITDDGVPFLIRETVVGDLGTGKGIATQVSSISPPPPYPPKADMLKLKLFHRRCGILENLTRC